MVQLAARLQERSSDWTLLAHCKMWLNILLAVKALTEEMQFIVGGGATVRKQVTPAYVTVCLLHCLATPCAQQFRLM